MMDHIFVQSFTNQKELSIHLQFASNYYFKASKYLISIYFHSILTTYQYTQHIYLSRYIIQFLFVKYSQNIDFLNNLFDNLIKKNPNETKHRNIDRTRLDPIPTRSRTRCIDRPRTRASKTISQDTSIRRLKLHLSLPTQIWQSKSGQKAR